MPGVHLFLKGPLSQWHPSPFDVDGETFNCAEQYMMAAKARLFGDTAMAALIMANTTPYEQKLMGSRVRRFEESVWLREREAIVYRANFEKFSQNSGLAKKLLRTGDMILAEANPVDSIWGIGLPESDPDALDPQKWRGLNLLGQILMRVRAELTHVD